MGVKLKYLSFIETFCFYNINLILRQEIFFHKKPDEKGCYARGSVRSEDILLRLSS
jgi:hypothetical protein